MIKNFTKYLESISGTTDFSSYPNYGTQKLPNTLDTEDTELISAFNGKIYNQNEFQDLYNLYLKMDISPKEDLSEFNEYNLNKLIEICE